MGIGKGQYWVSGAEAKGSPSRKGSLSPCTSPQYTAALGELPAQQTQSAGDLLAPTGGD